MVNGKWIAFYKALFEQVANQSTVQYCTAYKHSPFHAHIHTPTAVSTMQGDSRLIRSSQGEAPCSKDTSTLHTPRFEQATFRLAANLLYIPSHMAPQVGRQMLDAGNGDVMNDKAWQLITRDEGLCFVQSCYRIWGLGSWARAATETAQYSLSQRMEIAAFHVWRKMKRDGTGKMNGRRENGRMRKCKCRGNSRLVNVLQGRERTK